MIAFLKKVRDYFKVVATFIVFVIAIGLVTYMLPNKKKFRYSYHVSSVWLEDNLDASFSFSIYKTDAQLKAEYDSVVKSIKPYFNYDAFESASKLSLFKSEFDKQWISYSMREFKIDEEKNYLESSKFVSLRTLQDEYSKLIYNLLEQTYLKGIVQLPDNLEFVFNSDSTIKLVRGNMADNAYFGNLFTIRSAYKSIQETIQSKIIKDKSRQLSRYSRFFKDFDINRFLVANVSYDMDATERERQVKRNDISIATDYIPEGTRLISYGEIVTLEKSQLLDSYKREYEEILGNENDIVIRMGKALAVIIMFVVVYFFLLYFRRKILGEFKKIVFILLMMVFMIFLGYTAARFEYINYYIVPFAILPIILRTFFDERVALFVHIITVLLASLIAPNSFEFIFLTIPVGMVALFSLTNLYKRSKFFLSAIIIVITYILTYVGLTLVLEGNINSVQVKLFQFFGFNGILILLSFLLIYVLEKTFGFLSDTTLMELSDTNQPLLRRLAESAPATFQHSMQVANLSEEAVRIIGGNPMLVRTGALYHDIGKMIDASYFTENQDGGDNPHSDKDLKESAKIIIGHVTKGKELAKKNSLPEPIIDFILTHHGTSTTKYFLKTYQNQNPDSPVDESEFQYPGPRPMTKENAVLMMADSVEAASRSLPTYSKESISELVERIIDGQMSEGQFENAAITFQDIKKVKEVFKSRLNTIYHARIAYPK